MKTYVRPGIGNDGAMARLVRVMGNPEVIKPIAAGDSFTWDHEWADLGALAPGEYRLELFVPDVLKGAFVLRKDPFAKAKGNPHGEFAIVVRECRKVNEGEIFYTDFTVSEKGITNPGESNLCLVVPGEHSFESHDVSVFMTKGGISYLTTQKVYHGPAYRTGDNGDTNIAFPTLDRKNCTSPSLRQFLMEAYWPRLGELKRLPSRLPGYWEEKIAYHKLEDGELMVLYMDACRGLFFLRDKKGRHVKSNVDCVTKHFGCPLPTVGSICFAEVNGRGEAHNVQFIDPCDNAKRFLVDLRAFQTNVKTPLLDLGRGGFNKEWFESRRVSEPKRVAPKGKPYQELVKKSAHPDSGAADLEKALIGAGFTGKIEE